MGMAPFVTLLTTAVWMIVLLAFKRPSVSALVATVPLPALIASIRPDLIWIASALALGVFIRHRANMDRILAGEEPPSTLS